MNAYHAAQLLWRNTHSRMRAPNVYFERDREPSRNLKKLDKCSLGRGLSGKESSYDPFSIVIEPNGRWQHAVVSGISIVGGEAGP
jgi:hypothetical protein